ncbi:hypothetical protein [Candidatus Vallotia tarda]|nr:hypothetical protein [Candidatus Vallotia tarda]
MILVPLFFDFRAQVVRHYNLYAHAFTNFLPGRYNKHLVPEGWIPLPS